MEQNPRPLKRFGQNYLRDENIIGKIIDEFDIKEGDNILEIGPGRGALTEKLYNKTKSLTIVEIDKRVIDELREKFSLAKIINRDFLTLTLHELKAPDSKLRIIGNIPYNITSPILFKLIEERESVSDALLMVQYEVAKRIISSPGTKDYGILSVIMNFFSEVKLCFKISPNVFYPKPKVFSAIIKIMFNKKIPENFDDRLFIDIVKAAFGKRRKTLKNSLGNSMFKDIDFNNLDSLLHKRAEELSTEEFLKLYNFIQNIKPASTR
ncbi:16S rRNA (adenine(1518)-N(6)/adenine(1519)-N(6))-dimethyltransferase RsmA [Melioribacter sp. OK-6-Me]|uniref:16S rRNA (adenine(1518)-N(6)/adenine(1519)-N(6))- dimethyltransferase RsmA n=1 Tax=unclassified Melioribacter TaxID=2627329 RepID=UPI003EDB515B